MARNNPYFSKKKQRSIPCFSLLINSKFYFCVFPPTGAAEKHLISEKSLIQRFFKGAGVVLAGIECSPKIFDFRANGIPVGERVDFFDTLKGAENFRSFFIKPLQNIAYTKL